MVKRASDRQCKMVFFPECFDFVGRTRDENISLASEDNGPVMERFRSLAREFGLWISLGGLHHKDPSDPPLPWNSHVVIDAEGKTKALYKKLHLFDLEIPGKVRLMESEFSKGGTQMVKPVDTPVGRLGLSICYDLRFPELSLWNRYKGAEILSFPSAFTVNTGYAHWEALLRARAIETQCYVVAAAQTGKHNEKRSSYGHSMVIDPWGAIIAQCSERVGER
ncbi:hydrolase, carbon-nitrogen family [Oesophagostomum dentatum]|uniref:Hydrolase, carbon-nitrogen family n=1 Tax=Oesophagostomum dentatum TaxID=61180 RepID=A0A0B1SH70_OESDE|nr:hydrolase, carbon-nitrogen family [Oesophagostomum dentatum]